MIEVHIKGRAGYVADEYVVGVLPNLNGEGCIVYCLDPIGPLTVDEAVEDLAEIFGVLGDVIGLEDDDGDEDLSVE